MSSPDTPANENVDGAVAFWFRYEPPLREWLLQHSPLAPWWPPYAPPKEKLDDPLITRAVALQERDRQRGIRGWWSTYRRIAEQEWESGELDTTKLTEPELMNLWARALREGKRERAEALLDQAPTIGIPFGVAVRCCHKVDTR